MKKSLWATISFLLITIFVAFLRYLLAPIWPGLSQSLLDFSDSIKNSLNIKIDTYILSIIIFVVFFIIIYFLFSIIATTIRKKAKMVWDEINPHEKYRSASYSIVKLILIILFIPFIYAFGKAFISLFNEFSFENNRLFFFVLGFVVFVLIWIPFWKKFRFFSIFEHEFTHLITAMCFFHKPKAFHVDENEGGWVRLAGVNFVITLSPYFLLTLCFLMLPVFLLIRPEFHIYYFIVMGILTAYHTLSTIKETNFNRQPDLIFNGKFFSLVVIILGNIICYGFLLSFVLGGFEKGRDFILSGWTNFVNLNNLVV